MNEIGFFTAVSCQDNCDSNWLRLLEKVDSYFYIGGRKAKIISGQINGNRIGVQLLEETPSERPHALQIASYFTLIIPVILLVAKAILRSYYEFYILEPINNSNNRDIDPRDRINDSSSSSSNLEPRDIQPPQKWGPIQTAESKVVREYSGDLTAAEKASLKSGDINNSILDNTSTLRIFFEQAPGIHFTIRKENMFTCKAKVIVNAANTGLGGGAGIDGAIHIEGGSDYATAHRELQKVYSANYVLGHAAMIRSGDLKEKYKIDNVIVIAGPQGDATAEKEDELYSCYYNSLVLASGQNKESIAFPSISTGLFRFPKERAAHISLKAVFDFVNQYPNTTLKTISIHFLPKEDISNLEIYQRALSP